MSRFIRIIGNPVTRKSNRGAQSKSEREWQASIAQQTKDFTAITTPHSVKIVFNIKNWAGDHGPDIDNLLKPLFDGLKSTLLPKPTEEFILYEVCASKRKVDDYPGVDLLFY